MNNNVEVLIGNIASGKSTYCQKEAKAGAIIINDDSIVNAVHGGIYTLYSKDLKPLYKSIENHIFNTSIALNKKIIIDRGTNLTPESRKRWLGLASSLDVPCNAIVFEFCDPEIHAKRRMSHAERGLDYPYWLEVATLKNNQYIPPTFDEGFFKVIYDE